MRDRLIRFTSLAVALMALQMPGWAQEIVRRAEAVAPRAYDGPNAIQASPMTQRSILVDPNKRLGVGDQVSIEIVEDREGPTSRLITATGDLEVPPLDRVHIAGKTTTEAALDIKRRLEADYYFHATVKLSIDRVNVSAAIGKIYVTGEIALPGVIEFSLADPITLNEAILKTGGFKPFAKPKEVKVTRTKGGKQEFVVDVKAIQRDGQVDKDIKLEDGDRVYVPTALIRWN